MGVNGSIKIRSWLKTCHIKTFWVSQKWLVSLCKWILIAASPRPGWVNVIVKSQPCNVILGETKILFYDEDKQFIQRVANDPKLQKSLFEQLAHNLDSKTSTNSGTGTTTTATTTQNCGNFGKLRL